MGLLQNGKWVDRWYDTTSTGGKFIRKEAQFRDWITADGSSGFKAEKGRYHLYISLACPWACRVLLYRKLKGLEEAISLSVVHYYMAEHGWTFEPAEGVIPDPIHNARYLHEVYTHAKSDYSGRVTVPILWDRKTSTIVNNESSELIRMLNSEFDRCGANDTDFYPEPLREEIDTLNERIYSAVNNGVYRAGFATSQEAYEEALPELFDVLDWLDELVEKRPFLTGNRPLEADWRLFTTLIRFDPVYVGHFKCNLRMIKDYPHLWPYLKRLYNWPGVKQTVDFTHIKRHYYMSHKEINPTGVVPLGPILDYQEK